MFFGAYLGVTSLLFLVGLGVLVLAVNSRTTMGTRRQRLVAYTVMSVVSSLACLLVFVGLSAAAGLMSFGEMTNWNYPGDYLAAGPLGWALLLVSLLGVVSPLLVLAWLGRARQAHTPAV